jgi:hypothetical protein
MALVDEHGWAVRIVVDTEGDEPNFHYSAGITELCGHPELLVIGLAGEVGWWVVNEYGRRCVAGEQFEPGQTYEGFLEGHAVTFIDIDSKRASVEYTTWTDWYYERKGFPLQQLVWPDKTGAFPWQDGFREESRRLQPILGKPSIAP